MSRLLVERKTAQGRLGVTANIACSSHKLSISKTISVSKHVMSQAETEKKYEEEMVVGTWSLHDAIMTFSVSTDEAAWKN